jgi:hypothetical protein
MFSRWALLLVAPFSVGVLAAIPCLAQEDHRAEAAGRFAEGTSAFEAKDFRRAAQAFEAAYRLAPLPDVLWNAARAWHRAGEGAHAATLYARYLRDAPPDAADRSAATAQLAILSPKLGRIEVHGDGIEQLEIDGAPCEDRVLYVSRGMHVVTAVVGGKPMRKNQQVEAADVVSVVFDANAAPELAAPPPIRPEVSTKAVLSSSPEPSPERASPRRGWSPWVFATGAALTGVAVGFTIASGVDTENALSTFNASGTTANLSSGQGKQLRTNILFGSSIALGAATTAVGLWLVDWHRGGQTLEVGFEPVRGAVRGSF